MGKIEKKKVWTALLIIPPFVLLIALGPSILFTLMVLITTLLGLLEFFNLALPQSGRIERLIGIGLGLILSILFSYGEARILSPLLALTLLILSVLFMATSRNLSSVIPNLGVTFFGIFYVGFLLSHIILIRNQTDGRIWVLFLIITIWAGDIFALFSGTLLGRHKLYPKISPNKTYEGLVGAILGSVIIGLAYALLFIPYFDRGICILVTIGLGVLGQLGDFTESMLKRSAQVKDSGTLFPGHGGILDRIDSFLFSAPFFYHILPYLLKETP
ncbi:MAG: phosphatidate cytidylyltransferase [Thermodesulfobacteriota bacterium]|nr:phosphatidate cytidylyltransferase [Thermodesulfobacteriota bacterium]